MYVAQDRAVIAERMIEQLHDKDPTNVDIWCFLAALAERQADWEKAEKLLDDAQDKAGDHVALRLARAQFWPAFGADAGPRLKPLSEKLDKFKEAERLQLLDGLIGPTLLAGTSRQAPNSASRSWQRTPTTRMFTSCGSSWRCEPRKCRPGRHPGRHQAGHGQKHHLAVRQGSLPEHAVQGKPEEGGPRRVAPMFEAGR